MAEISTIPTDSSWDVGRNYQDGSGITRKNIGDAKEALEKTINKDSVMVVCQPKGIKFDKEIVKGSPFDCDKQCQIEVDSQMLLSLKRKIEDGKDAPIENHSIVTIYQPNGKEFKKGIFNSSSSNGSETNTMASAEREDPNLSLCKVASRELKSLSLLGIGFSGIVYETKWKEERGYARKDFVRVPSEIFEREIEKLLRLKEHSNVVQTIGWAVAKICCSLVLELMDCSVRSLAQRRKLLRRVTTRSELHVDSTSTLESGLDSGCSNSPKIPLIPQQQIEKEVNDSAFSSPVSASSFEAAQTSYPFSILEVIQIITAIAAGMKYLHDNKVAHGDLKPGNVLVTLKKRAGSSSSFDDSLAFTTVKLVDFGVIESKSMSKCMTSVSSETREQDRIRWKAPELVHHGSKQHDFDALAMGDVYSFGMTASEILCGEEPYSDDQNSGLNWKRLRELISEGTRPELPDRCPQLNELIRRCWHYEPTKRPTFGSILEELEQIRVALSVGGCPSTNSVAKRCEETPAKKPRVVDLDPKQKGPPPSNAVDLH